MEERNVNTEPYFIFISIIILYINYLYFKNICNIWVCSANQQKNKYTVLVCSAHLQRNKYTVLVYTAHTHREISSIRVFCTPTEKYVEENNIVLHD